MFPSQAVLLLAATGDPWAEFFFGLDETKRFVLILVAIGCLTAIIISLVGIIGGLMHSARQRRLESELKQGLLDRGMSVEEIVRVVESHQPNGFLERWAAAQEKGK